LQALNTSLHEKYHTISLKVLMLDEFWQNIAYVLKSLWNEFKFKFQRS
jgi:hypothetical protein